MARDKCDLADWEFPAAIAARAIDAMRKCEERTVGCGCRNLMKSRSRFLRLIQVSGLKPVVATAQEILRDYQQLHRHTVDFNSPLDRVEMLSGRGQIAQPDICSRQQGSCRQRN